MPNKAEVYAGLMSGTSVDSISASLVQFGANTLPKVIDFVDIDWPVELRNKILHAQQSYHQLKVTDLLKLEHQIALQFNQAYQQLNKKGVHVKAIGFHGQTIAHGADQNPAWTLQAGNPAVLAEHSKATVVAHVRQADLAAGGQGAPLAPAFHRHIFSQKETIAVLNLGGIANISILPADKNDPVTGYDTGPANCLMDRWIQRHKNQAYDQSGQWSLSGKVNFHLLKQLLSDAYFGLQYPKSTGTEYFSLDWLAQFDVESLRPVDVMATLREFSAQNISDELNKHPSIKQLIICGGGCYNLAFLESLQQKTAVKCISSAELGFPPEQIESIMMAWLARQCMHQQSIDFSSITGSTHPVIAGAIFPYAND